MPTSSPGNKQTSGAASGVEGLFGPDWGNPTSVGGGDFSPSFGGGASNLPTTGEVLVNSGDVWPKVYYGSGDTYGTGAYFNTSQPGKPVMVPASVYLNQLDKYYYTIGYRPAYDQIAVQLRNAGFLPDWKSGQMPAFSTVRDAYAEMLTEASYNPSLTPEQYLQAKASAGFAERQREGNKAADSTTETSTDTTTSTSSVVNLTDRFSAHALLNNALSTYLGRRATEGELATFKRLLNDTERANPDVSKSTTTTTSTRTTTPSADGLSSSSATSNDRNTTGTNSGGVAAPGKQQIAEEFARSRGDYAETTAATTGMQLFQKAIMAMNNGRMI